MPNPAEYLAFSHELANASGTILREAMVEPPIVDVKSSASPYVTEIDRGIEMRLRDMIADAYPDHGISGEEFGNVNTDAEFVWTLDPIDGTAQFVAGIPVFGTLIGLAHRGRPFVGIIDHPATGERWAGVARVMAEKNGSPIRTRPCASLGNAHGTCSSPDFMNAEELARFTRLKRELRYVQYGASCYAYGVLASGRTDLAVDAGLSAHDVFASIAVIEGAGGAVSDWEGRSIRLGSTGQIVAAGDDSCRRSALEFLAA